MKRSLSFFALLLSGCAAQSGAPSLAPRPAEAIDPRLPVEVDVVEQPVSPALVARLAALVEQARLGDAAFRDAAARAEPLVAAAGPAHGESWVLAQQAISIAQAARAPTTRALGEVDSIAATAIARSGGIPAADLAAIHAAAAGISAMSTAQAAALDALKARLAA